MLHFRHYSYIYSNFNIWLPVPLNRLETFDFSFISAKLNIGHFWVSDIKYRHEYGKISVDVSMRAGYPNRYRELLLAKAEYMGEISFLEKYRLYDFQMDEKLKEYSKREKL